MLTEKDIDFLKDIQIDKDEVGIDNFEPYKWIKKNKIRLVDKRTGKLAPAEFDYRWYIKDILNDDYPHIVVRKSAQIGVTICFVLQAIYLLMTRNLTLITTMPSKTQIQKFCSDRLRDIIHYNECIEKNINGVDNTELKKFRKGAWYFQGTQKDTQAIEMAADVLLIDERDFSDTSIIEVLKKRVMSSRMGWWREYSTPRYPNAGIDYLYQRSDKRRIFYLCENCGEWETLRFPDNLHGYYDKGQEKPDSEEMYYMCTKCGARIHRKDVNKKFIKTNPKEKTHGYYISQMDLFDISVEKLLQARDDTQFLKDFYNFNLGMPYLDSNVDFNVNILKSKFVSGWSDEQKGKIVMGVDQRCELHYVVRECFKDKSVIIDYGNMKADEGFKCLEPILDIYKPSCVVCDRQPETLAANAFMQRHKNIVYLAYYITNLSYWQSKVGFAIFDEKDNIVRINRSEVLFYDENNLLYDRLYILRKDTKNDKIFQRQILNEKRVKKYDKDLVTNNDLATFTIQYLTTGENHFRHALAYSAAAESKVKPMVEFNSSFYKKQINKSRELNKSRVYFKSPTAIMRAGICSLRKSNPVNRDIGIRKSFKRRNFI